MASAFSSTTMSSKPLWSRRIAAQIPLIPAPTISTFARTGGCMGGSVRAPPKKREAPARQSAYHFGPSVPKRRKTQARRPAHLERPTIPIAYLELLLEILVERGFLPSHLFEGLPIDASLIAEPRMSAVQWTRLVLRAQ